MSTEPRAYLLLSSCAATSTASEIAMPSEPGWSSGNALPDSVSRLGERCTVPPNTSISVRRWGFVSYDAPTCHTSHSTSKSAAAYDSAVPHWPAPVSVVSRRTPCREL